MAGTIVSGRAEVKARDAVDFLPERPTFHAMPASYQILQSVPGELVDEILKFLRDEERDVYKSALSTLATGRRLRPVFIQKRPLDRQIAWMGQSLKMKTGDEVAEQLLQVWLLKSKKDMLIKFLDEVGIEHDGEGSVDELPEELDADKLKTAVDALLGEYSPDTVKVYLHLFQSQRPGGWESLGNLLEGDERLAFA